MKRMGTKVKLFLAVFISAFVLLSVFAPLAQAANASLYFSPSSGSYDTGSTFRVSVFVSSANQAMNAASGVISYPKDKLEVTSLSKSGSIISLWVQEPSFSNSTGNITFEGIVLNPGFTGSSGKIITINFRVKSPGVAYVGFSSGAVLANDGTGVSILGSLGSASFSLGGAIPSVPGATTPVRAAGVPPAPQISSLTPPNPKNWYVVKGA